MNFLATPLNIQCKHTQHSLSHTHTHTHTIHTQTHTRDAIAEAPYTFSLTAVSEVSSNFSLASPPPLIKSAKLEGNTPASSEQGTSVLLVVPFSSRDEDSSPEPPLFSLPLPRLFSLSAFSLRLLASQPSPP